MPYRSKAYDYAGFVCGVETMDTWLQKHAGQNERLNRSRTFLLVDKSPESRKIYGYFALINCQISPADASLIRDTKHRYPMPATLLTRLAVCIDMQKQGIGQLLLVQAMKHTLKSLEYSASEVLLVDAIDDDAINFYKKFGLQLLQEDGSRLFIPTKKIANSFDGTENYT